MVPPLKLTKAPPSDQTAGVNALMFELYSSVAVVAGAVPPKVTPAVAGALPDDSFAPLAVAKVAELIAQLVPSHSSV